MLSVNRSSLNFLHETPLFLRLPDGQFRTLKEPGKTLRELQVDLGRLPGRLYIRPEDYAQAMGEIQTGLYALLKRSANTDNLSAFKRYTVQMLDDALGTPDTYSLEGLAGVVEMILENFAEDHHKLRTLALEPFARYTVAVHSVNVMLLCMCFCLGNGLNVPMSRSIGLMALMHDVGKTALSAEIVFAQRRLSDAEFEQMQRHSRKGFNILRRCDYGGELVPMGALTHHERIDGSGYPEGRTNLFMGAQLLGMVDSYEALTSDSRPYRERLSPFFALEVIAHEVKAGKFDDQIFARFVRALG